MRPSPATVRAARKPVLVASEHDEQAAVIAWARLVSANPKLPHLAPLANLFAIPNFSGHAGGKVARMRAGAKAKAEGRSAGVPDLFLPHAGRWNHGLFIEMKRLTGGSVSAQQRSWHARLREAGYRVAVCRGADAARDVLTDYLTP